jgi:nicotinate phosphoribosyltransferase
MKLSTGKRTLPGRKQVFREYEDGTAVRDTIARWDEALPGTALLSPVMTKGRRVGNGTASLAGVRTDAARAEGQLPPRLRSLDPAEPYAVAVSRGLADYEREVRARIADSMARDFA